MRSERWEGGEVGGGGEETRGNIRKEERDKLGHGRVDTSDLFINLASPD